MKIEKSTEEKILAAAKKVFIRILQMKSESIKRCYIITSEVRKNYLK